MSAPWLAALVIPWVSLPALLIGDGLLGFAALALVALRFRAASAAQRLAAVAVAPARAEIR